MADARRRRRNLRWKIGGVAFWAAIVAIVGLWQTLQYRGIMALFAEWQFNLLGYYYPSFTYLVFVAILVTPAMLLFSRVKRRRPGPRLYAAALRSAKRFEYMLLATAGALFGGALLVVVMMLALPTSGKSEQQIDLSKPLIVMPEEGTSAITGRVLYGRTAAFSEDLLIAHRNVRFAPVVAPQAAGSELQFFVELAPQFDTTHDNLPASFTGILQKNALPGELVRLYRYAGYQVDPPYYVLFANRTTLRWPYIETAVQLGLFSLLFLLVWAWQRRRIRRMNERTDHAEQTAETTI